MAPTCGSRCQVTYPMTGFDAMLLVMQPVSIYSLTCAPAALNPSSASKMSGANSAHTCGGRCQVSYALSQNGPREQREQRNKAAAIVGAVGEPKGNNKQHHPCHDEKTKASYCCAAVPQECAARTDTFISAAADSAATAQEARSPPSQHDAGVDQRR
jgi:hypothetical protein